MQSDASSLPVTSMYLPAAQSWQSTLLLVSYRPTSHTRQSDSKAFPVPLAYLPAPQLMQSLELSLPVVLTYLPAPQS